MARAYLAAATTRSPRSVAARAGRVAGCNGEDRRVTGPPGALADFVAAGTPEPVVRYRAVTAAAVTKLVLTILSLAARPGGAGPAGAARGKASDPACPGCQAEPPGL